MRKKIIKGVLLFLGIYLLCFLYSFFIAGFFNDEIWNYGFSYNIASGMVPYKDFNMVVTPLYAILSSFFIRIFGSYLFSIHLFNSLIVSGIIYLIYKKLGVKGLILVPVIFFNCYPGYNIFSVLIISIILNLVDKEFKYKDYVLGLFVGVMFLIKQNLGVCLFIPLLFYSKNKLKALIGLISPIILLIIYLIWNSAFYQFIDYAILGIFDFGESNSIWLFFPVEVIVCLWLVYKLFKSKFKDSQILYILMYQIVTVPIFDDYHFIVGFIPVFYYILSVVDIKHYKIKYFIIISLFISCYWSFMIRGFYGINLYNDKESYLYGRNFPIYVGFDELTNYIKDNSGFYDHIYFFSTHAYFVKLNANYKLDKFDLINNGNMGWNGSKRYISEIGEYCKSNNCMFILYKYEFLGDIQTNKEIVNFVVDNYNLYEEVYWFDIYINNK